MMIFLFAALTVAIELPWMAAWGYRKRDELLLAACVNVFTNLLLNLLLMFILGGRDIGAWIYLLETAVVAAEYAIYALAFGRGRKLFALTLGANALSYGIGLILF